MLPANNMAYCIHVYNTVAAVVSNKTNQLVTLTSTCIFSSMYPLYFYSCSGENMFTYQDLF